MTGPVRLSRRMVLEARQSLPDGAGGFETVWVRVGTLWADVRAGSGGEVFVGAWARPRVGYRIFVRAAPVGAASRPRPDQRLREGDRVFDVLTVTEHDPGGRYLEIRAEEGRQP